jgi:2-polyprenyl-3-methyl-5-hydroxy-6-metoxy-1,4-benzoquinol methylase
MKCRICDAETEPFMRIASEGIDEPFLDETLRKRLPELKLRRCRQCGCLWADDARQDEATLAAAYKRVSDSYFESPEDDPRYLQFYRWLEQLLKQHVSGKTILDVGCGDGTFLSTLSDEWSKRGIEPSVSGARLARERRLDVACGTLETTRGAYEVDLISALDVIEHVVDPHTFIDSLKPHLRKGGVVLLLTGDAEAYSARIAGSQWSYLRWCGHVSVFSRAGLRRLLESHGFEVVTSQPCEHPSSPGALAWWRVHLLEPARWILGRNKSWYPFWRDHQAVIARLSN